MPFLLVKSLHFQDRHHCHQKVRVLRLPEIQARKRWDKNEHDGRSVALETDSRCSIRIWDTIEPHDNGDDDFLIIIVVMMMSKAMTASCLQQVIIHSSRPGRIWQSGLFHTPPYHFRSRHVLKCGLLDWSAHTYPSDGLCVLTPHKIKS